MAQQPDAPAASPNRKPLKKGVAEAILATQKDIGVLLKTQKNKFANYDFVPIDTYYELAAPVAAKHGLTWKVNLILLKMDGDSVIFEAVVDLIFRDGKGEDWEYPSYNRFPIIHINMNAQTTGSASSYANKAFMRDTFKIASTGEADPDSLSNRPRRWRQPEPMRGVDDGPGTSRGGARPPASASRSAQSAPPDHHGGDPGWQSDDVGPGYDDEPPPDYAAFEKSMVAFAQSAKTPHALAEGWLEKKAQLDELKDKEQSRFGRVKAAFSDRKAELIREQAAAAAPKAPPPPEPPAMVSDPRMRPRPDQIAQQRDMAPGMASRLRRTMRPASEVRGGR